MQNCSDKSQEKQDESRMNEEDDSLMMTIEYLRARLLSERSISKATKERADELVKRVKELEEQLKVVTIQRKRAEKAARDVLSYLDSLGIDDNSEVYECDSNEEESESESNMDNSDTTKDDKNFESSKNKGNDKVSSDSEHESTTPSGRSLSWKGRKENTQLFDKKGLSSSLRSRSRPAQLHSSPRHRLAKSCRQIKRREPRSTVLESMHDSGISDAQDSNFGKSPIHSQDWLDFKNEKSKQSPKRYSERDPKKDEVSHSFQAQEQESDTCNSTHASECNGEMERALQHQAQLIRSYEAQEKAQRDWEEKYGENNDSCEPGSHSDVTEERDENKAAVPHPVQVDPDHGEKAGMETNVRGKKLIIAQFNSFKISHDADVGSLEKHNISKKQSSTSTPDFEFCVADNNQSVKHTGHTDSPWEPQNSSEPQALVPHKELVKLGSVLEALQEAKQVIKTRMNSSSGTRESISKAIEISDPTNRDADWLKLPARCPGLFRVPTDLDGQALSQCMELRSSPLIARTAPTNLTLDIASRHHFIRTPEFVSELDVANKQPRLRLFFPHQSSDQLCSQLQGNEAVKPPFGYPSFQNSHFRPNAYR